MACIRQYQRRALEALKPAKIIPFEISGLDEYFLNGRQVFLLGVSEGIGTCSDLHGINIAVFGKQCFYPKFGGGSKIRCEWAALLRNPARDELKKEWDHSCPCLLVVEGIKISKIEQREGFNRIYFTATGKKKFYSNV